MSAEAGARLFASGEALTLPVAIVVAHADDEALWTGTALTRADNMLLIHATDGAPRDMGDATRLGFASRVDYAAARAAELDRALAALGAMPDRLGYELPDQELVFRLGELVDRLENDLRGRAVVATHPYEGGHPDHDALSLAVRLASDRLARLGEAPRVIEFACYHLAGGARRFGCFWADAKAPEHHRPLDAAERAVTAAAIAAHQSQAAVIDGWRPMAERWRAAPAYRFTEVSPPGAALYDGFGWSMTSARWRALAAEAIAGERACA